MKYQTFICMDIYMYLGINDHDKTNQGIDR